VVATGTPDEVAKSPDSYTGQYLRIKLAADQPGEQKIA
jgi:excinuclease UvrABC ATPase subunit